MDLQNVRSLAHKLFCQCQEHPSSKYRAVAKSIRSLRNRLEEADEALDDTSFAPEDIRILEAAGQAKSWLNKFDTVLQRESTKAANGSEPDEDVAEFIAQFSIITERLSRALQDQEQARGRADLLAADSRRGHSSLTTSAAGTEHDSGLSRDTSIRSSVTSHSSHDPTAVSPDLAKLPAISEQHAVTPEQPVANEPALPVRHHNANTSTPPPTRSVSTAVDPNVSPDLRLRDGRFDAFATRTASDQWAKPDTLLPRVASPEKLDQVPQPTPVYTTYPGPLYHQLSQSLSSSHLPSDMPVRPRFYIANPDPGWRQPAELPADQGTEMINGAYATWQPVPSQSPAPRVASPLMMQHPALRYPYSPNEVSEQTQYISFDPATQQYVAPGVNGAIPLGHNLRRTESRSSEALPAVMRTRAETDPNTPIAGRPPVPLSAPRVSLKPDLVEACLRHWNNSSWIEAENSLKECLSVALAAGEQELARRMHHLLGAVASIQGHWNQAISYFVSVLRAPMADDANLDDGDCAAAYWLGDLYCLANRRAEALTAYMLAEHSSLFRGTFLRQRIIAEQKACIPLAATATFSDWKLTWDAEVRKVNRSSPETILRPSMLTSSLEQKLIDRARVRAEVRKEDKKQHMVDPNHSRVMAFRVLGADAGSYEYDYRLKIHASAFDTSEVWPLLFDPFFAMASVVRGRLLTDECDLLSVVKFDHASLSLPRAGRNRKATFAHHDLQWLIVNVRECLEAANMSISEVASATECGFVARWPASLNVHESDKGSGISTIHFLVIQLSRQNFGQAKYVVDVANEGLFSARIVRGDWLVDKGVPTRETDRVRAMVLEHLERAAKRDSASLRNVSVERIGKTALRARRGPFSISSGSSKPASIASR